VDGFFTPEVLPQREIAQISILRLNKKSAPTPIEQKGRFGKKIKGASFYPFKKQPLVFYTGEIERGNPKDNGG